MEKETKFEENLKELENIIKELETGEIDLDSSIEKYTKAMKLVSTCEKKLNEVEEKVNKILNENGNLEEFKIEENTTAPNYYAVINENPVFFTDKRNYAV